MRIIPDRPTRSSFKKTNTFFPSQKERRGKRFCVVGFFGLETARAMPTCWRLPCPVFVFVFAFGLSSSPRGLSGPAGPPAHARTRVGGYGEGWFNGRTGGLVLLDLNIGHFSFNRSLTGVNI